MIANKKEEMKDYMGDVKVLLAKYVPPDPQAMQQAFQAGKVSLNPHPVPAWRKSYSRTMHCRAIR